jgi:type III secretion protein U
LIPIIGVTIFAGIAANYLQVGSLFAFESISPSLEKISPGAGFKRIFSMKQIVETLKSIVKIVFLSVLLYYVVRDAIGNYIYSLACGMPCLVNITSSVLFQTVMYSALAFIIVALADFAYQKHSHTKSLMMTKDEIKREYKESEGDPHIKGHRRQLAQELAMSDSGAAARKGTAVVVNPTHFAVVISYRPEQAPLPIVTAKGRNLQAHYLRTQAEEAGVPVFRNVGLARSLFADVEIDAFIPDELFDAVAEVLTWVDRHKDLLYGGRLNHGVIDMDAGEHRPPASS